MHADLLAHVKWFTDPENHPTDWSLLTTGSGSPIRLSTGRSSAAMSPSTTLRISLS